MLSTSSLRSSPTTSSRFVFAHFSFSLFVLNSGKKKQQPLVQTAVWTIGEYGDLLITSGKLPVSPADIIDLLDRIVKHPATSLQTKQYILTAVVKLSDRLKEVADVKAFVSLF